MAAYVVLSPPHAGDEEGPIVVKDGFAWLAFAVPVLWFAFYRMWLWAAGFLVLGFALALAAEWTGWLATALMLGLLANLWAGLEGGAMRAAHLRRTGWKEADIVVAPGRDAAEEIHFADVATRGDTAGPPAPMPARANPRHPRGDDGPVLGLFDHDGGR